MLPSVKPSAVFPPILLTCLLVGSPAPAGLAAPGAAPGAAPAGARLAAPPASPVWPSPVLEPMVQDLLQHYYGQRAMPADPIHRFAPRTEAEKLSSAKDPDSLWQHGVSGAACPGDGGITPPAMIDCSGQRLAATVGLGGYAGGLDLFDAGRGYYANDALARMAGFYGIYHAFLHDHPPAGARNAAYQQSMVRAYEAHARDLIWRMYRDTRSDPGFQTSLTRSAGLLAMHYLPLIEFLEAQDAWGSNRDRRNAFAIANALGQRIWWEWAWTQTNGPVTAGFVNLGSQSTYQLGRPGSGVLDGTDRFRYETEWGPEETFSLRPDAHDDPGQGGTPGFWFDADYPTPGEWWCYGSFGALPGDALTKCLSQVARAGRSGSQSSPGPFSPYTQYYGDPGEGDPCQGRAYSDTGISCGDTNLGSIAEEWQWSFTGLRAALYLNYRLSLQGDPDLPVGAIGTAGQLVALGQSPLQSPYSHATERLGYGIAGYHGGAAANDDLEWLWSGDGAVRAVRTLSSADRDGEPQNGRYSVGELDVPPGAAPADRDGDTWNEPGFGHQEYGGAMENHSAGPSSLYGTTVLGLALGDKLGDRSGSQTGLAGSMFDASHRNHPDEFRSWLWLAAASYHRCPPAAPGDGPIDAACLDPNHPRRQRLYHPPDPLSASLRSDYLWRDQGDAAQTLLEAPVIAASEDSCSGLPGVPWRRIHDRDSAADAQPLHDEAGYGAYNELIQGYGGLMRLIAERWPMQPADPLFEAERNSLLEPWYDEAHETVEGILALYRNAPAGYGYLPEVENSTCWGTNPDPGDLSPAMISWQQGTGATVQATTVRRAMWYSIATMWYYWYAPDWLDLAPADW